MRVLHLTHTDVRVDSRILKELSALEAAGLYDLHAVGIAEYGKEGGMDVLHGTRVRSLRVFFRSARWLPGPLRHVLVYLEVAFRVIAASVSLRPRVIHCHDTPLLPVSVLLAWVFRGKVIYDAHELESNKNGQTAMVSKVTYLLEKMCWKGVDGFITVSGSIMRWYEDHFAKKVSALVLNSPLLVSADSVAHNQRRFHQTYGIPDDRLVFVYLGLFVPGRGIETLLRVFAQPDVRAHIVFVGRGSLRQMIQDCAKDNPRVHLHEAVPHEQVVPLVKSADYGVCLVENVSLSDYYSLPNKLFEYAFAGVPLLASSFPDMQEIVERYSLGECAANDEASITQAVLLLQTLGRQRVSTDLTSLGWAAQADRLRQLYQQLTPTTVVSGSHSSAP